MEVEKKIFSMLEPLKNKVLYQLLLCGISEPLKVLNDSARKETSNTQIYVLFL